MGNIQSYSDIDKLLKRQDGLSGMNDIIMTYAISQFASKHVVSQIEQRSHEQFMSDTLKVAMSFVANLNEGKLGLFQLNTGSTAEGLNLPQLFRVNKNGLVDTETADSDMLVIDNIFIYTTLEKALENKGDFYLDTSDSYPGFARVRAVDALPFHEDFLVKRNEGGKDVHYMSKFMIQKLRGTDSMCGPAITQESTVDMEIENSIPMLFKGTTSADMVYALNVTEWPNFMRDWQLRQTTTSSFTSILQKQFGCFLVGAAHRHSKDPDIEWRISCSLPELILARELTVPQRQAYMTFKYLVKETTKGLKGIMTYHLKTTLFWTVEQTPSGVWSEDNLAQCLYLLLDKFINFLAKKRLPNYFIPESNLFEHLSSDHIRTTLCATMELRKDPLNCLLKFQRRLRLQGHSLWWDHAFDIILHPHLELASKILNTYKDYPKSSLICLRQCLFNSVIELAASKLRETVLEDVYALMMNYLQQPVILRCGTPELPYEDQIYKFLVHLCHKTFLKTADTKIIFSYFSYLQHRLESSGTLTNDMKQKLILLEVSWNQLLAIKTNDYEVAMNHWDQCAHVLDSLDLQPDDVVAIAEYSCFFFKLWSDRYREESDHYQIIETGKTFRVLDLLMVSIRGKLMQQDLQFYGNWKLLNFNINDIEPNLTAFLESSLSCYVPHEIIALCVNILIIRKIIIPSVQSFESLTRKECFCKNEGAANVCDHIKSIENVQKFVQVGTVLMSTADQLLYNIVMLFNAKIICLDFHVPGERREAHAAVNFLLALVMMYAEQWTEAISVLSEISCPSASEVISKYIDLCLALFIFAAYNQLPERKTLVLKTTQNVRIDNESDLALLRHFPKPMYNQNVDMSSYGKYNSKLDASTLRVQIPDKNVNIEVSDNVVTFYDNGKATTYPFDRSIDNVENVFHQYLGVPILDISDQRQVLDELSAQVNDLDNRRGEIVEKMATRYGRPDS